MVDATSPTERLNDDEQISRWRGRSAQSSATPRGSRVIAILAPLLVLFTACQNSGNGLLVQTPTSSIPIGTSVPAPPALLGVQRGNGDGQFIFQFQPGTSVISARRSAHQYGLELIAGPLLSGPLAPGRYVVEPPKIPLEPITPTTALAFFPNYVSLSDRKAFLAQSGLRLIRWLRPDNENLPALVRLPSANLRPKLIDPVSGRFEVTLPADLGLDSVKEWAKTASLDLISYLPVSGLAVVHPQKWIPPQVPRPLPRYRANTAVTPPQSSQARLFVQFSSSLNTAAISAATKAVGGQLVTLGPGNLAIIRLDPMRKAAAIQLLSDNPSVQCVAASPDPCAPSPGASSAPSTSPELVTFVQPSSLSAQVTSGILELSWSSAAGATAYAVFAGQAASGPLTLVAIVAGGQHTVFRAFQPTALGTTTYYRVVALHPCIQTGDPATCDGTAIASGSQGSPIVAWTNQASPAAATTPATTAPTPSSSQAGATDASTSSASSSTGTSSSVPSATQSVASPAVVSPQPAQTALAAPPLAAPIGLSASAQDGHIALSWSVMQDTVAYRIYRSGQYIATTSALTFTDVSGSTGATYTYVVAAVAESGLVGKASVPAEATWVASTTAPIVLRSLPAQAQPIKGNVQLEVVAHSGDGRGTVQWQVSGPAAAMTIGSAAGRPIAGAALDWSARLAWNTNAVPDGTYTITATVTTTSGASTQTSSKYRIQNGAPAMPVHLGAVSQPTGVALTWQAPASQTTTSFELFRDRSTHPAAIARLSADRRSYFDAVAPIGQHQYQLLAEDVAGTTSLAAVATVSVAAPVEPAVEPALDLELLLPTGQPLIPGGRATDRLYLLTPKVQGLGFQLTNDGKTWTEVPGHPTCNDICWFEYDISSLTPGAYAVRAYSPAQTGAARSFVRAEPVRYSAPSDVKALTNGLGVVLTWSAPAGGLPSAYEVDRRVRGDGWQVLDVVAASSYIDANPVRGGTSDYRMAALDLDGTRGQPSNEITVDLPLVELADAAAATLVAPTGLQVLSSHGRAVVRWDSVPGGRGYVVERQTIAGGAYVQAGSTADDIFVDSAAGQAGAVRYRVATLGENGAGIFSEQVSAFVLPDPATSAGPVLSDGNASPARPTSLRASTGGGQVQLTWQAPPSASPAMTYNIYRMDPTSGVFQLAVSGLSAPSFTDDALMPGAGYGYVVTASSPSGYESSFSDPSWVTLPAASTSLTVNLAALPTSAEMLGATALALVADITAGLGLQNVAFSIRPSGGLWKSLPALPAEPRLPGSPTPALSGGQSAWTSSIYTSSLAPGTYEIRVLARDRAGRSQEKVTTLLVGADAARGPPQYELSTTAAAGGIHLAWSSAGSTYTVQRSILGPDGPYESIANSSSAQYDDLSVVPGRRYYYRVADATNRDSSVAGAEAPLFSTADIATIQLGDVAQSDLGAHVAAADLAYPVPTGVRAIGSAYRVEAVSLATGQTVHRLPAQARLILPVPAGQPPAARIVVLHWSDASATWIEEPSTVDSASLSVTATDINRLSDFTVAVADPTTSSGSTAQPPATTTTDTSSQPSAVQTPPGPLPYQIGPDGEVISLRSEYGSVYLNPDGSYRQTISLAPINFLDVTGIWQKVNTTLVPGDTLGTYFRNSAGSLQFKLPSALGLSPIQVTTLAGATSTFSLEAGGQVTAAISGSQALYAGLLDGTDARYTVVPQGLREELVINSRPLVAPVFTFDLTTGSLGLQQRSDGSVDAVDAFGQIEYVINAPWMHDSATTYSELGTVSNDVSVSLVGGAGSYRLTYIPSASWLLDPARIYPVVLDPSFSVSNSGGNEYDDQINSYSPDFNYHGYTYLPIGYTCFANCGTTPVSAPSRAMMQFNGFLYDGFYASSATLYAYQYTNYGTQRGNCCKVYQASGASAGWTYTGVTWNNQPGYTNSYGYTNSNELASAGWLSWDVTSLVRSWQLHSLTNNGFVLHATGSDETGPYNTNEFFYGGNSGTSPYLTINYDSYLYTNAVSLATGQKNVLPNGGSSNVEVAITNWGTASWGTDTGLAYRWWSGGVAITTYTVGAYVPYTVPGCSQPCSSATTVVLRFGLTSPSVNGTGPVYLQLRLFNNALPLNPTGLGGFAYVYWSPASSASACDQFYSPSLNCNTGTAITLADESATITWQGPPQVLSAVAGSLLTIPLTLTNNSTASGRNYSWHAYDQADLIRVGTRDYRTTSGVVAPSSNLPNLRTYLPSDVGPQAAASLNAVIQAPGEPGDYLLRVDLVHETPTSTVWFADQGNTPLELRARIVAPGDDKTTQVPVTLGDGGALGVSTSNGFATLAATDISIAERSGPSLLVSRTYNGVNGPLSAAGTAATSATYGLGWTFDFQRSLHLGSLGANTYDPSSGILTDASGKAYVLTWNSARGFYEDAAGNRTVASSSAQVTTAGSTLTVPGLRPIDLINSSGAVVADATAPGLYALRFETSGSPTALIMPSGLVPAQQNGSIEFWFKPNFDMSNDAACHVFFSDAQMRFGLAWNCPSASYSWGSATSRAIDFFTYDGDMAAYDILSSAAITWTQASGWHHISLTWAERGTKQLMTDTTLVSDATHYQSPIADLIYGYQANAVGTAFNYLNGRITQLRLDGRVVPGNGISGELWQDAQANTTLSATGNTLYLGHYDQASAQSAAGTYVLRNADQSTETYSPLGVLQSEADRFGNQVDYIWDSSGRIQTVSDHSISGRTISFSYGTNTFTATDFAGRTVTYQLNSAGELASVTRSNQVPDPRTGNVTAQNATSSYAYAPGHLLQQVTDPRGAKTTLNYDQSYRQVVLVDNPTAYWRLGEISGTTAADSAGGYSGTLHGGVTLGQGGAAWSDADLAYKLDGTSGYVSVAYAGAINPAIFTVEAWVMVSGGQGTRRAIVSTVFPGTNNYTGFELGANASNQWMAQVGVGTASWGVVNGSALVLNQWTYVVATYASGALSLYVNGSLQGTLPIAYAVNTGHELDLGADYYSGTLGGHFAGRLDEVAMTPTALSLSRIQAHFIAGRLGSGASTSGYAAQVELDNPIGYWRLGESIGSRALDQSGAGANGVYSGGYYLGRAGALTNDSSTATVFDGSTGTVALNIGNIDTASGHQVTVEFWMNVASNVGEMPFGFNLYDLYWVPSSGFGFNTGAGDLYGIPAANMQFNAWIHVAAVFTNGALSSNKLYFDGVQQTLSQRLGTAHSGTVGALANISGWSYDTSYKFSGSIEDLAVYNQALPQARIQAHYAAGRVAPYGGSPYPTAVLADRPSAYWRLGETSGTTAVDATGNGHAATYAGSYTLAQPGAISSDAGYSTTFDGSSAYVSAPTFSISPTVTVEAWIYASTYNQSGFIVVKNPANENWELFVSNNTIYWRTGGTNCAGSGTTDLTTPAPSVYMWHHVVAVESGALGKIYIDGLQVASSSSMAAIGNSTYPIEIGRFGSYAGCTANYYFSGQIAEVAIYPTALASSRILAHYQASRLAPVKTTGSNVGTYTDSVLADRPVGYWRMGEATGSSAADSSGASNVGIYTGGVTLNATGALTTDSDTAATFNGSTAYISVTDSPSLFGSAQVTAEAWVKATSWVSAASIVDRKTTGNVGGYTLEPANSSGQINFWVDIGGTWFYAQSAIGLTTGAWHYVAGVYDGAAIRVYVDGALSGSTSAAGSVNNPSGPQFAIGKNVSSSIYFNGSIDEVAVYPYALPASRITAHYRTAWDASSRRVATIQDGRGITEDRFYYNDDSAITQVVNAIGLPSYYTFQQYGGRTLSVTDTGNNVTRYEFAGGSPYLLTAVVSPNGVRHSRLVNGGAPIGQHDQTLMEDDAAQPGTTMPALMSGAVPDPSVYGATTLYTSGESWVWDSRVELAPGVLSHRSTPGPAGLHEHYLQYAVGNVIPVGAKVNQWVYLEPAAVLPSELLLMFRDGNGWSHNAFFGTFNAQAGQGVALGCPTNCPQGPLPVAGRWVQLTVSLGPSIGAGPTTTTLSAQVTSGTNYTALSVAALRAAIPAGSMVTIGYGAGTFQTVVASATAAVGATSITVYQFTASATFAASSVVAVAGDVDMTGYLMTGISFAVFGGTGSVWWGPTTFEFPGPNVSDPTRPVTRYAYNSSNDRVASVDPNGIATIRDIDASGLVRAASTGVEPAVSINLAQDSVSAVCATNCSTNFPVGTWSQEFGYSGTSAATSATHLTIGSNTYGSVAITHSITGIQSSLIKDFSGFSPGTYLRVSVWVTTSSTSGAGGGYLMVENAISGALNVQRRTAPIQTAASQWLQLSLPFVVDTSGQVRVHLAQENFAGTTTWAELTIDDLTPAPDVLLEHPLAVYATGFENANDTTWSLGTAPAVILSDSTQAHSGQYAVKDTLATASSTNTVSRSVSLSATATYRVSAWVRTVVSGSHGGANGAQLCAQFSGSNCTAFVSTESQWQQLQATVTGSGTLTVQLVHQNFQGDVYWDDVSVEQLAGQTPATSGVWRGTAWTGTVTGPGSATWTASWSGGVGGGPSRQVTISGTPTDVQDALATTALRTNASYVISVWASSSIANASIGFWLGSSSAMDTQPATCLLNTTPTLCQNSLTYTGGDRASTNLVVDYGATAATFVIGNPLIALGNQLDDYTAYGQVSRVHDIFGHSAATTFDSNSLYPTQTVVTATPSPNLITNLTYNSLGQLILSTRVNGGSSIADQIWLDSLGRKVGTVENCVTAVAPPALCSATPDAQTNVMTRYAYDLDGNLVDRYDQAQVSGNWVDTHYLYDADNNQVAVIQNCVTTTNPCDGASNASQNVVTATAYDALNRVSDSYSPLPGCAPSSTSCVPQPPCAAGPPPSCIPPATPCPMATCFDSHLVYDTSGRLLQSIANYGGSGDVSQANLTTQYGYDGDGHLTDTYLPVSSGAGQSGQVDEHRVYDALGRLTTLVKAFSIPSWMTAATQAETDYTLDLGGRITSVKGPDVGTTTFNANRILNNTDYDDLGRALSVTVDPTPGLNAVSRTVYDPRGHVHSWTPPTQVYTGIGNVPSGMETSQNFDLAGQLTSVVKDDGTTGFKLTSSTVYDGYGRATDVTDPRGIVTHTAYDALDRATSVTLNYCPAGNTNPNCSGSATLPDQNVVTSYVFDLAGNRTQVINPRSIVEFTAFDALHRATSTTEDCQSVPAPPSTSCGTQSSDQNVLSSQSFDQAGDILTTTDSLGRVNVFAYDPLGRKASETINCLGTGGLCNGGVTSGQNLTTSWQYDAQGELLKETRPRQCTSAAPCYNGASITDGLNLATAYAYDGLFRLVKVTEDANRSGPVTTYTYDPSGNRLSQTDGNGSGHTTTYTIDNLGRTTKVTDANANVVQTNYDAAGEVVSTVDARGKTNANTLDSAGRLTGVSYFNAAGNPLSQSFGYDNDGNRTSFSDTDVAQTTVSYDHLNRVSTVTAPSPYGTTSYSYFMDGAVNTIADANGTTTFGEDGLGRTASMVTPLIAGTTGYNYDAAGRLTSRTEANGIVTTVTYTGADQLASKTEVAGSTTLASWTNVSYDLDQNRTAETLSYYAGNPYPDAQAGTSTYLYDTLDQLSQATLPSIAAKSYGYDPAHNLTNNAGTSQSFNSNESLHTACAVTFTPDADGNLNQDCSSVALSWNSLSQLEKYGSSETYTYDALGRLTTLTNGANVTKFVYQGISGRVIQELNSANAVVRSYAWDSSRQLYVQSGGNTYYQISDPHGDNVTWAIATGLVGTEHFDPWGNPTYTPSGTTMPFGFQGGAGSWTDAATSFVSMGVRWDYPKISEFLSSDPAAGTADARTPMSGLRWAYAANDPIEVTDPTGFGGTCVHDASDPTCGGLTKSNGYNATTTHTSTVNARTGRTSSSPNPRGNHGSQRALDALEASTCDQACEIKNNLAGIAAYNRNVAAASKISYNTLFGAPGANPGIVSNWQDDPSLSPGAKIVLQYLAQGGNAASMCTSPRTCADVEEAIVYAEQQRQALAQAMTFVVLGYIPNQPDDSDVKGPQRAGSAGIGGAEDLPARANPQLGQVEYGSTDLSQAVIRARTVDRDARGMKYATSGNYAAAELDDGTVITARSGSSHAEKYLVQDASDRGLEIKRLYSEREPCSYQCQKLVKDYNVTWTWDWNAPGVDSDAVRGEINRAIRAYWERQGI